MKTLPAPRVLPAGLLIAALSLTCGSTEEAPSSASLPQVRPAVVRTLAHDTLAFTQGLVLRDGFLFESTGRYGHSSLRKIDAGSGVLATHIPVDRHLFGEGLAFWEGRLVQLTWRAGRALVYAYPSLELMGVQRYTGEGWGLAALNGSLVMSDGSDTLRFLDEELRTVQKLPVTLDGRPLRRLNELEYARGLIYANVWHSDFIFEIDPTSGAVRRVIDCTELAGRVRRDGEQDVLNGIAFDESTGVFYLTGKNWPLIFVATIPPPGEG
jgi:glutamine cyclotransferase